MIEPPPFVHLRIHSEYSLVDGLCRIKPLIARVAQAGMPAVAVTDHCNLFAMVKLFKAAESAGVKPILGVDLWLDDESGYPTNLLLLCQDGVGYRNLARLITRAYQQGQGGGTPLLQRAWLTREACHGLIALSGGHQGDVGRALVNGHPERAEGLLRDWRARFPDRYYLEVTRTGRADEEDYLHACVALADSAQMPVVATNDVRFLHRGDFEAHEARVCIHQGRTLDDAKRPRYYSEEQYLKTPEEMAELFADLPEALANTIEIARRCNLDVRRERYHLPQFPLTVGHSEAEQLRAEAVSGLGERLQRTVPAEDEGRVQEYYARLEHELGIINTMGFAGYFLIVADFIQWAKDQGIPVGPGRGSGAGSLVAYALRITDLDPLAHDLLFERFLNPERVSMPDFDVDFCMDRRDEVIDYVADKYGRERVSQIITFGTMAAKAVVRDVGRVLSHPYGFVDRIAKLVPPTIGMTLERALTDEAEFKRQYDEDEEVRAIIDLALSLEGLARNAGKHAGGVVIGETALTDFTPLYCEPGGESLVTQFDKDDVESIGLVKFDFLGLRTLTIIDWAVQAINAQRADQGEPPLDLDTLPSDDRAAFDLLKQCLTTAVFQLESRGMKELIKRLQPDTFADIVALVALYRPGPLQSGMVDDYINRKHGRAAVQYPHPMLEPILRPTYGVILYQEQVMQIAQVLAGYSLGDADLLRRAMGKKKLDEMASQRVVFLKGAAKNGVPEATAESIFDLMEKFAGYGFNKSHSAAYALLSYRTAWLKAHYPAPFMAAVLSSDMDNTDKVVVFVDECRALHLDIRPPHVNHSVLAFTAVDERSVRYGLGAIKGLGAGAISDLVSARERGGPFSDLIDLCLRVDLHRVTRRALEALVQAGALDGLGANRATLFHGLSEALRLAEQRAAAERAGQRDLFGGLQHAQPGPETTLPAVEDWSPEERLRLEREVLGLYLSGHPLDALREELRQMGCRSIARLGRELEQMRDGDTTAVDSEDTGRRRGPTMRDVRVAGLVIGLRTRNRDDGREAFVTIDDGDARMDVRVFPEAFVQYRDLLAKDQVVIVEGKASWDDYSGGARIQANRIDDVATARARLARRLVIALAMSPGAVIETPAARAINGGAGDACANGAGLIESSAATGLTDALLAGLATALESAPAGGCPVFVRYQRADVRVRLCLGERWQIQPTVEVLSSLERALVDALGGLGDGSTFQVGINVQY